MAGLAAVLTQPAVAATPDPTATTRPPAPRSAPAPGALQAWGDNVSGELGIGTTTDSPRPLQVRGLTTGVMAIAGGNSHALALADGHVFAWGANFAGQLGDGTTNYSAVPVPVRALPPEIGCPPANASCVPIAAGGAHSLALLPQGVVFAWGANNFGQLGNGTTDRTRPDRVPIRDVVAIAAGDAHSLALKSDGTVWTWGFNEAGQLGNGTTTNAPVPSPVRVVGLDHVVAISAGMVHSVALKDDGSVWTWGGNNFGQQGHPPVGAPNPTPAQVTGLGPGTTKAIAAGGRFVLALRTDGTVMAWGHNDFGQLGNGTAVPFKANPVPAPVRGLDHVVSVVAGGEFSLALRADGALYAWGFNGHGQLGRTSEPGKDYDTLAGPVAGLTGPVLGLAAGSKETLAITPAPGPPPPPGVPLAADPPPISPGAPQSPARTPPPPNVVTTPADPPVFSVPTMAADPGHAGHLALATSSLSPDFTTETCWLSLSSDGGATWSTRAMFGPPGPPIPAGGVFCDRPGVAFTRQGALLYVFKPDDFVYITASGDGGVTFSPPQQLDTDVKTHGDPTERDFIGGDIGIDRQNGDVYIAWARFSASTAGRAPLSVAHCTPSQIQALLAGNRPGCGFRQASPDNALPGNIRIRTTVGPDHRVYLAWGDEADSGAAQFDQVGAITAEVVSSSDFGATWTLPSYADRLRFVCPQGRCASNESGVANAFYDMSVASPVGPASTLVVAMSGPRFGDPHKSRVALSSSPDGGRTWEQRRVVGVIDGDDQHAPEVTASPDGRVVAVSYYDLRFDGTQDTYVIVSTNGGSSFSPPRRLSDVSSSADVLQGNDVRPAEVLLGDAVGVAWVDSRRGTPDTGKTDIVFARS